jgi:PPOX class probable F420-dependent enzyme
LANIARSGGVALNFNSSEHGGDVAVFHGEVRVDPNGPSASEWDRYIDKYRGGLASLNISAGKFREQYSTLIRVTPQRLRGW